ncbi:IS200/IS605 family element transposase accessory protein TnpB [Cyanobacterium aponinum FACHB-4101]|uniref:RNA-guided endonuclease InsQ/TnpB family protein n=1 Tax=Cyanobacterium aponinum TaxID=379064 RepID=UPI0016817F91|nr:RNA-guided endonuclease TnpB family protein [Cyanobacterium aponinum]MBD2395230.1 IS200/IS605 family element transposase accessory protein TnpB [Cyanobacterium aponinum FACHB-4101]
MNYKTIRILLKNNISDECNDYLQFTCEQSNKLYNSTVFLIRQSHFEDCPRNIYFDKNDLLRSSFKLRKVKANYPNLCKELKTNVHYQAIGGSQGQQTIKSVAEAFKAYNQLLSLWFKGEIEHKPKMPSYRKNGLYAVSFTKQQIKITIDGYCRLPIPKTQKDELVTKELIIPSAKGVNSHNIAEVRIVPSLGKLWAEFVYKTPEVKATELNYSQALGIDTGVSNLITAVSTKGKSFILCGKRLKFINQKYNKTVAQYKNGKSEFYWDEFLDEITHKRNCQVKDSINKYARFIINYCLNNRIGDIVFGWGQGVKSNANLGKRNNQNFVQLPTVRLKNRIKELADEVGIRFTETEESYTSKSSFLDNDLLPKYGEKPREYKFSGKRINRGLYKTAKSYLINADCNGAINILKKVSTQLGITLAEVSKEALTLPKRYNVNSLTKVYRKRSEQVLTCVATSA